MQETEREVWAQVRSGGMSGATRWSPTQRGYEGRARTKGKPQVRGEQAIPGCWEGLERRETMGSAGLEGLDGHGLRLGPGKKKESGSIFELKGSASEASGAQNGGEPGTAGPFCFWRGRLCTCAPRWSPGRRVGPAGRSGGCKGQPRTGIQVVGGVSMERAGEVVVVEECVFFRVRAAVLRSCLLQVCRWRNL